MTSRLHPICQIFYCDGSNGVFVIHFFFCYIYRFRLHSWVILHTPGFIGCSKICQYPMRDSVPIVSLGDSETFLPLQIINWSNVMQNLYCDVSFWTTLNSIRHKHLYQAWRQTGFIFLILKVCLNLTILVFSFSLFLAFEKYKCSFLTAMNQKWIFPDYKYYMRTDCISAKLYQTLCSCLLWNHRNLTIEIYFSI